MAVYPHVSWLESTRTTSALASSLHTAHSTPRATHAGVTDTCAGQGARRSHHRCQPPLPARACPQSRGSNYPGVVALLRARSWVSSSTSVASFPWRATEARRE